MITWNNDVSWKLVLLHVIKIILEFAKNAAITNCKGYTHSFISLPLPATHFLFLKMLFLNVDF